MTFLLREHADTGIFPALPTIFAEAGMGGVEIVWSAGAAQAVCRFCCFIPGIGYTGLKRNRQEAYHVQESIKLR